MTVLTPLPPGPNSALDRSILLSIFSAVGRARVLDEKYFDACTALAGSGPAFACVFLEAMADGGEYTSSLTQVSILTPKGTDVLNHIQTLLYRRDDGSPARRGARAGRAINAWRRADGARIRHASRCPQGQCDE